MGILQPDAHAMRHGGAHGRQQFACLVRLHDPTDAALERMLDWAVELHGSAFAFWVSIDRTSHGDSPHFALRDAAIRRKIVVLDDTSIEHGTSGDADLGGVYIFVHQYDETELLDHYPSLVGLRCHMRQNLAWGFHVEAVSLWFRCLEKPYRHVWIFEDDVGYTGNILHLLSAYHSCSADLLVPTEPFLPEVGWPWRDATTTGFRDAVGEGRLQVLEMVLRVSARLLALLARWAASGHSAWSEMAWPTVARLEPGLTMEVLRAEHVGTPFKHNGDLARPDFELRRVASEGRLVHALKFGVRARLLKDAGEGRRDVDLRGGLYHCEFAVSQWRRWTSVLHLEVDGSMTNGWDRGHWYTLGVTAGAPLLRLVLDWDRWPADIVRTQDRGHTWEAEVLPSHAGESAGFIVLRRADAAIEKSLESLGELGFPSVTPCCVVGVYTAVHIRPRGTAAHKPEEVRLLWGGLAQTASGRRGAWALRNGGLQLSWQPAGVRDRFADVDAQHLRSADGGFTWLAVAEAACLFCMARRSGRTGESAEVVAMVEVGSDWKDSSGSEVWESVE